MTTILVFAGLAVLAVGLVLSGRWVVKWSDYFEALDRLRGQSWPAGVSLWRRIRNEKRRRRWARSDNRIQR